MIGHETRWVTYTFSVIGFLVGLTATNAVLAEDAAVVGCRADEQSTEMTTDCDSIQEAKVVKPLPPPTTTPPVILYMELPGEGDKHDHDRGGNGRAEHDASGRKI